MEPPDNDLTVALLLALVIVCALAIYTGADRDEATKLLKGCFTQEPFVDAAGKAWVCSMRELEVRR